MILPFDALSAIRRSHSADKIVFCSGSFDLLHPGHVLFLEDCKRFGSPLVVGVGSDRAVRANKQPDRPIMSQASRMKLVDSIWPVDYVVLEDVTIEPGKVGLLLEKVFASLRPNRYVINEDAVEIPARKAACASFKVPIAILPRRCPPEFDNISTSKIIEKIRRGT